MEEQKVLIALLTCISGVPKLNSRAAVKWGGQVCYEDYSVGTSVWIPRPPSGCR